MTYRKEYYQKNREKLLEYQKVWNKKHYKPKNNKYSERALKAWETRRIK